ncbi:ATP-grasp domain-containing protein [Lutibaculum baratangense]|uniref:Succinyl-CoA ligase [ADP-forming] beta chain n=1 Tax=Lutibaculum baratangense AMV1 TaxID=631454 RepID=V4QTD0_9HYPH|nr:ATP-grasp domain-containing protein [Lutibaculum baratangense]ESR23002.1 Succinyl-CoA ligase [ADP-forming] beta chain [Lutibaculum baratangense AMV1]
MDLCEWDAKSILRAHGLPVPHGRLVRLETEDPGEAAGMVKAQLLSGGRGKAGLVRPNVGNAAHEVGEAMRRMGVPPVVLLEEPVAVDTELYLACALDDLMGCPVLLFSAEGGVEVEAGRGVARLPVASGVPPGSHEILPFLRDAGAPPVILGRLSQLAADLCRVMAREDASLVEINPLAVTGEGRLVALDCKMTLDDSALWRHRGRRFDLSRDLADLALSPAEREARERGFQLVEMPGDVVLVSAGAGLGMLCADLLMDAGFRAGTFFENAAATRGDTTEARLDLAWRLAESSGIRAIMFYQALSTRDLAPRVEALLRRLKASPPRKPFYFGLSASFLAERTMTAAEARRLVEAAGFPAEEDAGALVERMARDRDAGLMPTGAA